MTALVVNTFLRDQYEERLFPFLSYYRERVSWDIILLDNASDKARGLEIAELYGAQIIRFPKVYYRPSIADYLFQWRSLYFMRSLLREFEYKKLVFIESDFLVISPEMWEWIDGIGGWATVWSGIYGFPESAFQVITPCKEFIDFTAGDFKEHHGRIMEHVLPFTCVERGLVGDRYAEIGAQVPADADYIAQATLDQLKEYAY